MQELGSFTHNQTIPQDKAGAIRWIVDQLLRIDGHKAMLAEQIRDVLAEARDKQGMDPAAVRNSVKYSKMSPERREAVAKQVSEAMALFGYSPLGVADVAGADANPKLWRYMESLRELDKEKAAYSEKAKEIKLIAKEADIDIKAIQTVLSLAKVDPATVEDQIAAYDQMATFMLANGLLTVPDL